MGAVETTLPTQDVRGGVGAERVRKEWEVDSHEGLLYSKTDTKILGIKDRWKKLQARVAAWSVRKVWFNNSTRADDSIR